MNKKIAIIILLSALITGGVIFFKEKRVSAQTELLTPFGGEITYVKYCCNGLVLTITGEYGGDFLLNYYDIANPTVDYLNYQVYYGGDQPVLGQAFPVGVCVDMESECEDADPVEGGTIMQIGTGFPGGV